MSPSTFSDPPTRQRMSFGSAQIRDHLLDVRFTGSGSEYFRIWSVNLLLMLVTLSLYYPWAKVRRLRYFYGNTLVDGQPLDFHGSPLKMLRGYLLVGLLLLLYSAAGKFSPVAGLVAFLVVAAIWPALLKSSLQFRLANTSWRGLRMGFEGSLKDAYWAVAPLYVPLIAFIGLSLFAEAPSPGGQRGETPAADGTTSHAMLLLAAMATAALTTPWFLALTKRYQHNGYFMAGQHTWVDLPTSRVYGLCLKGGLVGLLPGLLAGVAGAALAAGLGAGPGQDDRQAPSALLPLVMMLMTYLLAFLVLGPYLASRLQNLVWSATRSRAVSVTSRLKFRALFWLTLKNWTLVALTLSLYRPFAAVHTARLRLQAVSVTLTEDVEQWEARRRAGMQDATGDIAGDFFGIDMGL